MDNATHLVLNENRLAEKTLEYILNIQNTYLECILYQVILDPREKYGDLNNHLDFLKDRLSHLEFKIGKTTVEFENDVSRFTNFITESNGWVVDDFYPLYLLRLKIEEFSKEIFWANENEEKSYLEISRFNCFEEKRVPQAKMAKVFINPDFFNAESWIQYYQDLLDLKFQEFSEKIVVGKNIIKYKPFKDGLYLGIETDYQFCRRHFKKGDWEEPEYKLIIFRKINEKKIEVFWTFEKFTHPFFSPPTFSFDRYEYMKNSVPVNELQIDAKYIIQREFFEDGSVRLYMSEEFGEYLKRHAYFYFEALYQTTKEYIKFIKESFEE